MHKKSAVEESILAAHHLLFPLSNGSDWLRQDQCGETPMIRSDEYHITQFVPSNPNFPGKRDWRTGDEDPKTCRDYFANMRKHAVKALYGNNTDSYMPKQ